MPDREYNTVEDEICEGCSKRIWMAVGYVCEVYEFPRKTYGYRMGKCAINGRKNKQSANATASRVRVGQQKNKRSGK
jgi:hypothetical protein